MEVATENQAVESYVSFCKTTGCFRTGFSNPVTLSDFQQGYFIQSFDLSASAEAYNELLMPVS